MWHFDFEASDKIYKLWFCLKSRLWTSFQRKVVSAELEKLQVPGNPWRFCPQWVWASFFLFLFSFCGCFSSHTDSLCWYIYYIHVTVTILLCRVCGVRRTGGNLGFLYWRRTGQSNKIFYLIYDWNRSEYINLICSIPLSVLRVPFSAFVFQCFCRQPFRQQ